MDSPGWEHIDLSRTHAREPLTFAPAALPPGTKLQAASCGLGACSNSWRLLRPWLLLLLGLHQGCCCTAAWHPGAAPGVDGCLDAHVLDRRSPADADAAVTRAVAGWRGACCSKPVLAARCDDAADAVSARSGLVSYQTAEPRAAATARGWQLERAFPPDAVAIRPNGVTRRKQEGSCCRRARLCCLRSAEHA